MFKDISWNPSFIWKKILEINQEDTYIIYKLS